MKRSTAIVTAVLFGGLTLPAAADTVYNFNWTPGDGGAVNNGAGEILAVDASFDTGTNRLQWYATFGEVIRQRAGKTTDAFTLAISPGANPKGHAGELALLYFDASGPDAVLTAYAYNGHNSISSYRDGSPESGEQTPDRIASSLLDQAWINDLSVTDHGDGTRTLGFDIDAGVLNAHNPLYPGPEGPSEWTGAAFGEAVGVWFHPFSGFMSHYTDGFLSSAGACRQGWLDGSNFGTTSVPIPAALPLGVAGFALVGVARKRRRMN